MNLLGMGLSSIWDIGAKIVDPVLDVLIIEVIKLILWNILSNSKHKYKIS